MEGTQCVFVEWKPWNLIYKHGVAAGVLCVSFVFNARSQNYGKTLKIKKWYWQGCFNFVLLVNDPMCKYYTFGCVSSFAQIWQTLRSKISAIILQGEGMGAGAGRTPHYWEETHPSFLVFTLISILSLLAVLIWVFIVTIFKLWILIYLLFLYLLSSTSDPLHFWVRGFLFSVFCFWPNLGSRVWFIKYHKFSAQIVFSF